MFAEQRMDDFYAIMRKRVASLWCRMRATSNSILRTVAERVDGLYCQHRVKLHTARASSYAFHFTTGARALVTQPVKYYPTPPTTTSELLWRNPG
ncbi:hypothetical protein K1T71_010763 [Dendrolimus kikuchii]|uniref:Uncharacterized protein n=1 Tax=Dendrolimus kikuchii TaxID=765133 RepID=A0ACC1CPS8_9NEOP|nr:hypothetical protein K1T71_010763 [Dendrolimus kikuchii]